MRRCRGLNERAIGHAKLPAVRGALLHHHLPLALDPGTDPDNTVVVLEGVPLVRALALPAITDDGCFIAERPDLDLRPRAMVNPITGRADDSQDRRAIEGLAIGRHIDVVLGH